MLCDSTCTLASSATLIRHGRTPHFCLCHEPWGTCAAQVRQALESEDVIERLRAVRRYAREAPAPGAEEVGDGAGAPQFPPPPGDAPRWAGPVLEDWAPAEADEILVS